MVKIRMNLDLLWKSITFSTGVSVSVDKLGRSHPSLLGLSVSGGRHCRGSF